METPELQAELKRKTLETMSKLASERNLGKISEAMYKYGIEVMWSTVAGLVDDDFREIAEKMSESVQEDTSFLTKHIIDYKGGLMIIENNHKGKLKVTITGAVSSVKEIDCTEEFNPPLAALERQKKLCETVAMKNLNNSI